jgi:hypothetical protein
VKDPGEICVGHSADIPDIPDLSILKGDTLNAALRHVLVIAIPRRLSLSFRYSLSTSGFAQATALPASPRLHASVPWSTLFWGLLPTNEVAASDTAPTQENLVGLGHVCIVHLCMHKPR